MVRAYFFFSLLKYAVVVINGSIVGFICLFSASKSLLLLLSSSFFGLCAYVYVYANVLMMVGQAKYQSGGFWIDLHEIRISYSGSMMSCVERN